MGELADRLEQISVEAASPDGRIRSRVSGRLTVGMAFVPRAYRWYDEVGLAYQLRRLATLTWTRYRREYLDIENSFLDWSIQHEDQHDRRFAERVDQLTVTGSSAGGWVTARSRALLWWDFELRSGALRQLAEQQFVAEALGAALDAIRAYRAGRARLLDEYYDLAGGLPPFRRPARGRGNPASERALP